MAGPSIFLGVEMIAWLKAKQDDIVIALLIVGFVVLVIFSCC